MQPELVAVGERARVALELWQSAYAAIEGAGISADLQSVHTPGASIADINVRVTAALSALARLKEAVPAQLALVAQRLPGLKAAVDAIESQAQGIRGALEPWHGSTSTDRNGHLSLQLSHSEKGSTTFDLGSPFSNVNQHTATVLESLPYIAQVLGEKSAEVFGGLARAASDHLIQARSAAEGAAKELQNGERTVAELKALVEQASSLVRQVDESLKVVTTSKGTTEANTAEVVQKLAQVREVSKDADSLQQRVTSFASQFEAFEAQMKARLDLFTQFETSTKDAQRINNEREEKIAELTIKADEMIRGASTAGLSKSLEDAKGEYELRLARTEWFFLGSVAFLLVSALPIAAQLVPGPWQQFFAPNSSGSPTESAQLLSAVGKLILVLPGTWATAFFAANYAELFHLSREYAHKAALAKAIDGFRREAPAYKEEIVGSVFMEIQDNPGSRRAPRPATPQNPVTQKFLEKVLNAIRAVKA